MPQAGDVILTRRELNPELIDPLYLAAVQAVEEAVANAIVAGEDATTVKPPGLVVPAIDTGALQRIFTQ